MTKPVTSLLAKPGTCFGQRGSCQRNVVVAIAALSISIQVAADTAPLRAADDPNPRASARLFFTSQGKTAVINADGSGLKWLEFDVPNQVTWQPGSTFSDGRSTVLLSMEPRRDGPGKPFDEYYTQTPTHIWKYNLDTGALDRNLQPRSPGPLRDARAVGQRRSHPGAGREEPRGSDREHEARRHRRPRFHARRRGLAIRPEPGP